MKDHAQKTARESFAPVSWSKVVVVHRQLSRAHQLIGLNETRILDMQPIRRDTRQGRVIQHHHAIRVVHQPFHCQKRIVRLDDDVGRFGKNRVGLNEFFRESVVEPFEEEGSEA